MPTLPNADATLSGGSGTTKALLVPKIVQRLDDDPWTEKHTNAPASGDLSLTVAAGALNRFQVGGRIDWLEDGTFESALIEAVADTALTIKRGFFGSTAASHSANAYFRYQGRVKPHVVSAVIDDQLDALYPEIFDVRSVDWTISASAQPELWYATPAGVEKVMDVYQLTNNTPLDTYGMNTWGGPVWREAAFLGGGNKKGLQIYGVSTTSNDGKLHAIYAARPTLAALTTEQEAILVYLVGAAMYDTVVSGETKPERRAALGGTSVPTDSVGLWLRTADEMRKRESKRLQEYIPHRDRIRFRGARHFADHGVFPGHTVRGV